MKADESGSTTKNNKGFAFVQFEHIDDATKAVSNGASLKIGMNMGFWIVSEMF